MSTGSGAKPPSGSQPGRPAAVTPQRRVVRSGELNDPGASSDSFLGANDTAVAAATARRSPDRATGDDTPSAGIRTVGTMPEIVGTTLSDRYLVTRKVGQGGMGAVYEATHTLIGKRVAVKVLLEKYAQREAIVARLKQEAQLASSIGNEHIIDITDFGTTQDGRTFVVMEFLVGESLAECLAHETRLPEQRILRIAQQTTSALSAAHDKGIVHRDIKPENLFLLQRKETDFVKVVDFGISKSLRTSTDDEEQVRLTQTGMVLGTPLYMSPEQARGDDELDHRVDLYALGVIMYETATGRVPYAGNNYLSVISQVLNEEATPLRELRPDFSEEFEAIVLKAMAKERGDRYTTALDMHADISALIEDPTHSTERAKITGPRRRVQKRNSVKVAVWIGAIALTVLALVVTVTFLMKNSTPKPAALAGVIPDAARSLPLDAALAVVAPVDAATAPMTAVVTISFVTDPAGAEIFLDNVKRGVSPLALKVVQNNKEVKGFAAFDGYDDGPFTFNPLETGSFTITLKLKKPARGTPAKKLPHPAAAGSASTAHGSNGGDPANPTNGEMGGFHDPNSP